MGKKKSLAVNFQELSAVERSVLSRVQAFCGQCDQTHSLKDSFHSSSRMTIIKGEDGYLYFYCPNPDHQGDLRACDALFRLRLVEARLY